MKDRKEGTMRKEGKPREHRSLETADSLLVTLLSASYSRTTIVGQLSIVSIIESVGWKYDKLEVGLTHHQYEYECVLEDELCSNIRVKQSPSSTLLVATGYLFLLSRVKPGAARGGAGARILRLRCLR